MNFDFTDDQHEIKRTARDLLGQRSSFERVRAAAEAGTYDETLWRELRDLGWTGIAIGEEHGGAGLGQVELVILMEELGYAVAGSPFLANALGGLMIEHAGSDEQRARWLPGIASGGWYPGCGTDKNCASTVTTTRNPIPKNRSVRWMLRSLSASNWAAASFRTASLASTFSSTL